MEEKREPILNEVLSMNSRAILLEMGTGLGKTRLAIEKTHQLFGNELQLLVVVPTYAVMNGWPLEFKKAGREEMLKSVTFTTYDSLSKRTGTHWDMVIFDEAHHLTDDYLLVLRKIKSKNFIFLTATMRPYTYWGIKAVLPELETYTKGLQSAMEDGIISYPTIILMPMKLDTKEEKFTYEIVPKKVTKVDPKPYVMTPSMYWKLRNRKDNTKYTLRGTAWDYNRLMSRFIEGLKKYKSGPARFKYLNMAGIRLKWLSRQKDKQVKELLEYLKNERTLTFCSDIEHTEVFGPNSVHSKKEEDVMEIIDAFNRGEINHIQTCRMLNEGVNLVNCRIGIFANISSSDIMNVQRIGRILRHVSPILIFPYFVDTREEEIVNGMVGDYNPELVKTISKPCDLKL